MPRAFNFRERVVGFPEHSTLGNTKSSSNVRVMVGFRFSFFFTFSIYYIEVTPLGDICDRISHNRASTHTKSNLRFYQKWIAGLIHYHIPHCTSFRTGKSGFCGSFLPTLSKPRVIIFLFYYFYFPKMCSLSLRINAHMKHAYKMFYNMIDYGITDW